MEIAIWLGLLVLFGILEAATVALVSLWFMAGSLAALIAALCGAGLPVQVGVFLAVSALLLACLRPLVRRYVTPRITATNADSVIGKVAVVTEAVDNIAAQGAVKVGGVVWTARSSTERPIPAGTQVRVDRIEGVKLFVTPAEVPAMQTSIYKLEVTNMEWIWIAAIIMIALIVVIRNIRVVQQSQAYVIERLGAFSAVWGVGIHIKIPFLERVAKRVSLKEQVLDYPPQPVITKDNVTMQIDTVVYFQITDPKLYAYGVEQPMMAMETLTATTLRNIIGDLELDQTLTSRDVINTKMRAILDEATDPWGIKVNRVELKNILPPADIQSSMEKQMKAERDRRQAILQAEGTKKSAILIAEGEKESAILRADAEKQAAILKAEAEKQAAILRADGEAQAILAVQKALADSLAMLNRTAPNDQVIKLKALEAMQKVADGKATKIIIPSEIQGLAGLAEGLVESVKEVK